MVNNWIPVTDHLPEPEKDVLIAYKKTTSDEFKVEIASLEHVSNCPQYIHKVEHDEYCWIYHEDKFVETYNDHIAVYYWKPLECNINDKYGVWKRCTEKMPEIKGNYVCLTNDGLIMLCNVNVLGYWSVIPDAKFSGDLGKQVVIGSKLVDREVIFWTEAPYIPKIILDELWNQDR